MFARANRPWHGEPALRTLANKNTLGFWTLRAGWVIFSQTGTFAIEILQVVATGGGSQVIPLAIRFYCYGRKPVGFKTSSREIGNFGSAGATPAVRQNLEDRGRGSRQVLLRPVKKIEGLTTIKITAIAHGFGNLRLTAGV